MCGPCMLAKVLLRAAAQARAHVKTLIISKFSEKYYLGPLVTYKQVSLDIYFH